MSVTRELMTAASPRIAELSAERVREEFERMLAGDGAVDALRLARDVGALAVALPEWAPCIGLDQQSATQAYTLDEHILHVLEAAIARGRRAPAAPGGVLARRRQAPCLGAAGTPR